MALSLGIGLHLLRRRAAPDPLLELLIASWHLESDGTDSSGNGNTLTGVNTPTFAAGKIDNAASLASASNQGFTLAGATDFANLGSFTVNAWLKLTSVGVIQNIFALNQVGSAANIVFRFQVNAAAQVALQVADTGGSVGTCTATTFGALSTGTWYMVTGWWDAALKTINVCVNAGTPQTPVTRANGIFQEAAPVLGLGVRPVTPALGVNGLEDEALTYGKVLTAADLTRLYNGGAGFRPI